MIVDKPNGGRRSIVCGTTHLSGYDVLVLIGSALEHDRPPLDRDLSHCVRIGELFLQQKGLSVIFVDLRPHNLRCPLPQLSIYLNYPIFFPSWKATMESSHWVLSRGVSWKWWTGLDCPLKEQECSVIPKETDNFNERKLSTDAQLHTAVHFRALGLQCLSSYGGHTSATSSWTSNPNNIVGYARPPAWWMPTQAARLPRNYILNTAASYIIIIYDSESKNFMDSRISKSKNSSITCEVHQLKKLDW